MANQTDDAPCVWISTTVNNVNAVGAVIRREFTPQWREAHSPEQIEWSKATLRECDLGWKRGEILTKEQVGEVWYYNSKAEYYTAPFINGGGFPLLSKATKAVLEQYELGNTVFHPLTLIDPTESYLTTPEPYFLLNVGNKRPMGNYEALGPEGDNYAPLNCRGEGIVYLPRGAQEAELVVVPEALGGPDIWVDPKVPILIFLSDQLVSGLKAAGVDKGWGLVRVPVGTL